MLLLYTFFGSEIHVNQARVRAFVCAQTYKHEKANKFSRLITQHAHSKKRNWSVYGCCTARSTRSKDVNSRLRKFTTRNPINAAKRASERETHACACLPSCFFQSDGTLTSVAHTTTIAKCMLRDACVWMCLCVRERRLYVCSRSILHI